MTDNIKQKKPNHLDELGYFLAGLIDADGHINKKEFVITFHENDLTLAFARAKGVAYYLKAVIGYGSIRKLKNKRAYNFEIYSKQGFIRIARIIQDKLRLPLRIKQFNSHVVSKINCRPMVQDIRCLLNNYWLAGFIQSTLWTKGGDGSFQIKLLKVKTKLGFRVQLTVQVSLKTCSLLRDIQNCFGGYVGFRSAHDTYYYSSGSFISGRKFVHYLDIYQVMGVKFKAYRLWKKAFEQVEKKAHLTKIGLETIKALKTELSNVKKKP